MTLFVLINLQNQSLKRQASLALACSLTLFSPPATIAQDLQVLVPAHLLGRSFPSNDLPSEVSFGVASYQVTTTERFYQITASLPIEVLRPGPESHPLFRNPTHFTGWTVPECVRVLTFSNSIALKAIHIGTGTLQFEYRAPLHNDNVNQQITASIPLLNVPSGQILLRSPNPNLEFQQGNVWEIRKVGEAVEYAIGVAGSDNLIISNVLSDNASSTQPNPSTPAGSSAHFYGIRITESQQLTVIHSDGSCAHFAEFVLPPFHPAEFPITLPEGTTLISVALDGTELTRPQSAANRLIIPLERPASPTSSSPRRLSLRLNYPLMRLGFVGFAELPLPKAETTIGTLRWVIALPHSFHLQIISSGLENQLLPADLSGFGDYARILKTLPQVSLSKNLLPPTTVQVRFKYSQNIP